MFIYFSAFIFLYLGLYFYASQFLKLPSSKTKKGFYIAVKRKADLLERLYTLIISPLAKLAAPFIHLESYKEEKMKQQLKRAEIPLSPKEYYARSIVSSALVLLGNIFLLTTGMQNMIPVVFVLAVIVYFHFFGEIKDKLKEKDKMIAVELPRFIRAIVQGLSKEKDLIRLFEMYAEIAKEGLKYDVEVLILDMKAGNFEDALTAFDARVGNDYISRLTKALIAVDRGENQESTLNHLISDMAVLARENMQRELAKRPGKVKLVAIPLVIIGIVTLFYVIGMHLFNSIGGLF